LTPKKVVEAVMDAVPGVVIQETDRPKWRPLAAFISTAAGEGEELHNSPEDECREWIAALIAPFRRCPPSQVDHYILDADDPTKLATHLGQLAGKREDSSIYSGDGTHAWFWVKRKGERPRLVLHAPSLVRWVTSPGYGARTSFADVKMRLRRLGFRNELLSARDGDSVAKARVWVSPPGFDPCDD
jgi:hypothetical protein